MVVLYLLNLFGFIFGRRNWRFGNSVGEPVVEAATWGQVNDGQVVAAETATAVVVVGWHIAPACYPYKYPQQPEHTYHTDEQIVNVHTIRALNH